MPRSTETSASFASVEVTSLNTDDNGNLIPSEEVLMRWLNRRTSDFQSLTVSQGKEILGIVGLGAADKVRLIFNNLSYLEPIKASPKDRIPVVWTINWEKLTYILEEGGDRSA